MPFTRAWSYAFPLVLLGLASCGHTESAATPTQLAVAPAPIAAPTRVPSCVQDSDCMLRNECGCCVTFMPPRPSPSCASMCAGGSATACENQQVSCQAGICVMTPVPIPANAVRANAVHGSCDADADCRSGLLMGCTCEPYGANFHMGPGRGPDCAETIPCDGYTPRCDVAAHECVLIPR